MGKAHIFDIFMARLNWRIIACVVLKCVFLDARARFLPYLCCRNDIAAEGVAQETYDAGVNMKLKIMMLVSATSLAVFLAPQAIAGPGKSGDNSSSGNSSASNSNADGGMLTARLANMNTAHANDIALDNAAVASMPGKLAVYKAAFSDLAAAEAEVIRIAGLTEAECLAEFSTSCADALTAANTAVGVAEADLEAAIVALTGDTELDADVEAELHALLGI